MGFHGSSQIRTLPYHVGVMRVATIAEEVANAVSHGVAWLLAVAALPILIIAALDRGAAAVVASSVFGSTLVLMYGTSTLYHALPTGTAKRVFRVFDHAAIYLLIAGTYTPFTLAVLTPAWGWTLFGVVWGLALVGVTLKTAFGTRLAVASLLLYLVMGWLVVVAAEPLLASLPPAGVGWLLSGGIAYTLGVPFFVLDARIPYAHFVWHLFVVAGSFCHVVAIAVYT